MGRKKVLQIVKDVDEEENRCCGFLWSKGSSRNSNKSADDSATDMISLRDIFKFSTTRDYVYVTLGFIGAILTGQGWAVNSILFGWIVDVLLKYELNRDILNNSTDFRVLPTQSGNQTMEGVESEFMDTIWFITYISFSLSIAFSAGTYIAMYYFQKFSVRQVQIIMERYFTQILRQDISWFDKQNSGEFASRISGDLKKFEHGINENLAMLLYNITGALFNLGASFFFGWKLTLAILTVIPFIIVGSIAMARLQSYYIQKEVQTASAASTVAEETISAIRTVFAFGGEKKEAERYDHELAPGLGHAIKRNIATAIGNSINWGMMYVALAIGIFYGVKLVLAAPDSHTPGDIIIIFWCVNGISYNVAYAAPHYEALQIGRTAAANIFRIISQKSRIDSSSIVGERLSGGHKNDIEFKNVHFSYPTRPNIPILQGLNLKINSGEIVALVGASGCGKSTIIQLIQRFYDPSIGEVLLDGTNLRELNVGWLREQIGVVGQEPVLFDDSIEQNIRLGLPQDKIDVASMDDIIEAAKEANAHDFISKLPSTYDTYVGDRGTQLSGGQKQRIAIARALISHPKILLLDEATSALDLQSEQVVQAALDRASLGRTTVIVAHRLSTIINADRIVFFEGGKVLEEGTHEELMSKKSAYYGLVKAQEIAIASDVSDGEEKKTAEQHQPPPSKPAEQEMERYRTGTFNLPNLSARMKSLSFSSVNSFNGSALQYSGIEDFEELAQASKEKFPYARFGRLIWQDKWMFMTAFVCALGFGLATPIYAVILGDFVDEFRHPDAYDEKVMIPKAIYYTLGFILLAIIVFVINVAQISLFGIISEKLTLRLRQQAYAAILNQDIAWFDNSENSTGALCSRLTNDAANIQGATGLRISMMCQCASTLVASVAIGFFYSWQLALVGVVLMPVIALSSIASAEIYSSQAAHAGQSAQRSVKVVIEVMNSIRTVVSLHKENYFFANFTSSLTEHSRYVESKMWIKAVVMAIAVSSQMWAYTAAFLAGGYVMISGGIRSGDFFRVVESMIFGACVIGESAILSSDFARAKLAALSIFKLIDRQPMKMLEESGQGKIEKLEQDRAQGNIQFRGIRFAYPSRPEQTILDGLSFSAEKGQTVALVGSSGCGKSTSIQLLEQFYTPSKGKIYLDGEGIHHLDRDWARRQMALVSQEPILFSYSIAQNIAYGDNSRHVPFDEIVRAAQLANVSDFIKKLPQGYDTPVGSKGTQLSGGQKQRIAIARALIRDPPILLLDEATSALDTASESVVQKALEEAAKGRTCLVIAHRLKTIVNAHKIVVLHKGQAVEEGTHSELLDLKGHYWRLYNSAVGAQES